MSEIFRNMRSLPEHAAPGGFSGRWSEMELEFERHVEEDNLELYAMGRLDEGSAVFVEEHLLICEGCRVRLDEADRYVNAMRSGMVRLKQESRIAAKRPASLMFDWFRIPATGWAAAALAFCAVASVVVLQNRPPAMDQSVVSVALSAERGNPIFVPAHHNLDLKLDARGLDLGKLARVELVDGRGSTLQSVSAPQVGETVNFKESRNLDPGAYYVRLYPSHSADLAREFALVVK